MINLVVKHLPHFSKHFFCTLTYYWTFYLLAYDWTFYLLTYDLTFYLLTYDWTFYLYFSYFWGWLSDKFGRRPILLITIFFNGFFSLAFGFTYNFPMAMITRFLTGLANGKCVKVVIIKTGLTSVYDCISLYVETDLTCGRSVVFSRYFGFLHQ